VVAIVGGVMVVIVIGVWALLGSGNDKPAKTPPAQHQPAVKEAVADKEPRRAVPAVKTSGQPGKTPDRPAPEIQEADLVRAEEFYKEARKLDIQARKAQTTGDNATFNRLINDAWDKLEAAFVSLEAYDAWLDEAILEDWALPGSYVRFGKRLEKLEKLQGRIKRVRPPRRK
jgi:hypothetical protein